MMHVAKTDATAEVPPLRPTDLLGALGAFGAEAGLVWAFQSNLLPLSVAVMCHFGVAAALIVRYMLRVRRMRDGSASLLLAFMVLVAGPCGALGGLFIGWLSRTERSDVERLSQWYERIALSTDLSAGTRRSDRISTGRIADLRATMPQSFSGVLEHGNVHDKQMVLGLIARRFHADYLPALKLALVSEEPVIRVQAAAVAAKIRGSLAARVETALTVAADPTTPIDTTLSSIAVAEKYVACGLMEEPDKQRAEAIIDGVLARISSRIDAQPAWLTKSATTAERYEARLIADRRFADLRRLRRAQAWRSKHGLRFRTLSPRRQSVASRVARAPQQGAAE